MADQDTGNIYCYKRKKADKKRQNRSEKRKNTSKNRIIGSFKMSHFLHVLFALIDCVAVVACIVAIITIPTPVVKITALFTLVQVFMYLFLESIHCSEPSSIELFLLIMLASVLSFGTIYAGCILFLHFDIVQKICQFIS